MDELTTMVGERMARAMRAMRRFSATVADLAAKMAEAVRRFVAFVTRVLWSGEGTRPEAGAPSLEGDAQARPAGEGVATSGQVADVKRSAR